MTTLRTSALLALLAVPAAAQTPVLSVHGATPADRFGAALAPLGDLDGDGHDDFVVGAPFDNAAGTLAGAVYVVSGRDGSILRAHGAVAALDHFGSSVAVGDVDGDGTLDYVAGAPEASLNATAAGYVEVYSGQSGAQLWQFTGDFDGDRLGVAVASGADVDADGCDDVIAGAFGSDAGGLDAGLVRVYSGKTGALLLSIPGTSAGDRLGIAVAGLSDVDGDGFDDFVAGADQDGIGAGYATVYSGASGFPSFTLTGSAVGDATGFAVCTVGFVDTDAVVDFAVASPGSDVPGSQAGRVELVSGQTGAVLVTVDGVPGAQLGRSLAPAGDEDGDGRDDVLVGAPFEAPAGAARIVSGLDGAVLRHYVQPGQGDDLGAALGRADVDGDLVPDVLVGAPRSDLAGVDAGSVFAFDGAAVPPAPPVAYCTAKTSSIGCVGAMAWSGLPSATDPTPFVLTADAIISQRPGVLIGGFGPFVAPFQGGTLCVAPPLMKSTMVYSFGAPGPPSCTGTLTFDLNAWMQAGGWGAPAAGTTLGVQFWYRDGLSPSGPYGLTNAVQFDVRP